MQQNKILRRHLGGGARSEIISSAMQSLLDRDIDTEHPAFLALAELVRSLGGREPTSVQDAVARLSRQVASLPQEDAHLADIESAVQQITTLDPLQSELQEAYALGLDDQGIDAIFDILHRIRPDIEWREHLHDVDNLCQALSEQIGYMPRDSDEFRFTRDRLRALLARLRRRETDTAERARMEDMHETMQRTEQARIERLRQEQEMHRAFLQTPRARSFADLGRHASYAVGDRERSTGKHNASVGDQPVARMQRL